MSWNDGGKRDWDAFIATDESVDSELTDGDYGSSWKRVCLEGGQEDGGSGGIGDRGSPGFTVDDPCWGIRSWIWATVKTRWALVWG